MNSYLYIRVSLRITVTLWVSSNLPLDRAQQQGDAKRHFSTGWRKILFHKSTTRRGWFCFSWNFCSSFVSFKSLLITCDFFSLLPREFPRMTPYYESEKRSPFSPLVVRLTQCLFGGCRKAATTLYNDIMQFRAVLYMNVVGWFVSLFNGISTILSNGICRICSRERDTKNSLRFFDTNESPSPGQKIKPTVN